MNENSAKGIKEAPLPAQEREAFKNRCHIRDLGGADKGTGITAWITSIMPFSFHLRQRRQAVTWLPISSGSSSQRQPAEST
jgi:hypothetical protein